MSKDGVYFNSFSERFFPVWQERHSCGSASVCAGWRIEQRFFISLWTRNKTQAKSKGRSNSQTPAPSDLLLPPRIHFLGVFPQAAKEFPKAGDWAFKAWGFEGPFRVRSQQSPLHEGRMWESLGQRSDMCWHACVSDQSLPCNVRHRDRWGRPAPMLLQ